MEIPVRRWRDLSNKQKETILQRSELNISEVSDTVKEIIRRIQDTGDAALKELSLELDKVDLNLHPLRVSEDEFDRARQVVSDEVKDALLFSIENVRIYHEAQLPRSIEMMEIRPGVYAGERATPIDSAAIYIPRGRGSFPSMLYMLAVPATIAGVPRIAVLTPPDRDGGIDPACLYTAEICGVEEIYRFGGAHGIAAMALGTESVSPVDKIIGPGSMYVAAAKRLLSDSVDIGLPAGPSESAILADAKADPYLLAIDLLTEAEHGADSSAILVCTDEALAARAAEHLSAEIEKLPQPRKDFVHAVFSGYGAVITAGSIEEAAEIINLYAPEHLQVQCHDPFDVLPLIRNAGEIILGSNTPFSAANYAIGANAVLPTGGRARTYSPVSVRDFMKYSSVIYATRAGNALLSEHVEVLAEYEGFPAHKNAVLKRR
ncbi:histidinol dehydrogenase [Marispirochaeta sp.]|jgi:histidinol dehydrogenase|uniref:histidinol dehydrogenase n=1 Tax=Marispirochaeta sp. TaxID=2038653 RepID=UPI0029C8E307|nr:histidinol dehydrogenase [Marispirochaeta sp.]